MKTRTSPSKRLVALVIACSLFFANPAHALYYYDNDPFYGIMKLDTQGVNSARVGTAIDVAWELATASESFDYGTSISSFGYPNYALTYGVPAWWSNHFIWGDFTGNTGIVYYYRTNVSVASTDPNYQNNNIYLHVTYNGDAAEGNLGFGLLTIRGCWVTWASLPSTIEAGDTVSPSVLGQDDDGLMSSVTVQVSTNGGGWSTFMTGGSGSSGYPSGSFTAGSAGTTYQFRAWATDTNGYQSHIITSGVYTTQPPPPPVNYKDVNGTDLASLFKALNGGAKTSNTGMTCVIGGITYDLSDRFLPRVTAARASVGYTASNGQDLSLIFEKK